MISCSIHGVDNCTLAKKLCVIHHVSVCTPSESMTVPYSRVFRTCMTLDGPLFHLIDSPPSFNHISPTRPSAEMGVLKVLLHCIQQLCGRHQMCVSRTLLAGGPVARQLRSRVGCLTPYLLERQTTVMSPCWWPWRGFCSHRWSFQKFVLLHGHERRVHVFLSVCQSLQDLFSPWRVRNPPSSGFEMEIRPMVLLGPCNCRCRSNTIGWSWLTSALASTCCGGGAGCATCIARSSASLFWCEEVGFVSRVHLLSGEVRSVTTALKVVEEVQEEVQEIEDEWGEEEVRWNGELKVEEKRSLHVWTWQTRTSQTWPTMWCANHDDQNLTTGLCAHGITRASIHVLTFMCAVWKVLWVLVVTLSLVSCVLSLGFTTQT